MTRLGVVAMMLAAALAACAGPGRTQVEPPPVATPAPPPAPAAPRPAPVAEAPRQADQLARVASELVELQNAIAKLMMSARQHDDQLLYMQRRLTDLEAQMRGRSGGAPIMPPSASMLPSLPPPPASMPAPSAPVAIPAPPPPRTAAPSVSMVPPSAAPRPAAPAASARPVPPASSSTGAASPADDLYREGLTKYQSGDLDGAVVTLYEVVANYPSDPARERAQLLVGEIFFAQKDYRGAVAELEGLIAAVPGSARVPEALLKIGMAQRSLGDEARARRAWERLLRDFPTSAPARQARTLLRARG